MQRFPGAGSVWAARPPSARATRLPAATPAAPGRESGSVTAETAVALPALVLVLAAALWAVTVAGGHLRCVDAARAGARAAARGEPPELVREAVLRAAPEGAGVVIFPGADTTRVEVVATVRPLWKAPLPPVRLRVTAVSATEPGVVVPATDGTSIPAGDPDMTAPDRVTEEGPG